MWKINVQFETEYKDHSYGDNSFSRLIIGFRKKATVFLLLFNATFKCGSNHI